jgi:hypothetical protein
MGPETLTISANSAVRSMSPVARARCRGARLRSGAQFSCGDRFRRCRSGAAQPEAVEDAPSALDDSLGGRLDDVGVTAGPTCQVWVAISVGAEAGGGAD